MTENCEFFLLHEDAGLMCGGNWDIPPPLPNMQQLQFCISLIVFPQSTGLGMV